MRSAFVISKTGKVSLKNFYRVIDARFTKTFICPSAFQCNFPQLTSLDSNCGFQSPASDFSSYINILAITGWLYTHIFFQERRIGALNISFQNPRESICSSSSLHFSGFGFYQKILELGCRDLLSFSHKSISEVWRCCRVIRPGL